MVGKDVGEKGERKAKKKVKGAVVFYSGCLMALLESIERECCFAYPFKITCNTLSHPA